MDSLRFKKKELKEKKKGYISSQAIHITKNCKSLRVWWHFNYNKSQVIQCTVEENGFTFTKKIISCKKNSRNMRCNEKPRW